MAEEKSVQFHATKQLLLDTVLSLLETENPAALTTEKVLTKARVSIGSLYHHFEDLSDLLEQALCIEFESFTNRTIDLLLMTNEQAKNLKQWGQGVQEARRISHGPQYARNRMLRVWAVAYASMGPRMKARLGDVQDRLNAKFVTFVRGAQKAGWMKKDLDPLAVSVFIQAYQFGAVIDDVAQKHLASDVWINILNQVSQKTLINNK